MSRSNNKLGDGPAKRLVEFGRRLLADRLTTGTGGNLSLRERESGHIWITPSGIPYDELEPDEVSLLDNEGQRLAGAEPSSEWHLHLEVYRRRPEVGSVVHTHSPFATTFAILRREIPACHYLIGVTGGSRLRVAPYSLFGTPELAQVTAEALGDENCILMANHGLLAVGQNLEKAYAVALYCEEVAELYHRASSLGEPSLLSSVEMEAAIERFQTYGRPKSNAGTNSATQTGPSARK